MQIALHIPIPAERVRAADSLRGRNTRVWCYGDAAELCAGLAAPAVPDAVVTALRDAHGRSVVPLVRRLRVRFPSVPVVAYATPSGGVAGDLVTAAHAGVAAAAFQGIDDLASVLQQVVAAPGSKCVADAALAAVGGRLTPETRPIVGYCLTQAHAAPSVMQVAAALGVSRKTVAARLAAEGLPPSSAFVGWGRVLLAARRLEDAGCPVECVALALGFDSGTGLRHMLARYTGLRAAEVRARGGLAGLLPLFAAAVLPRERVGGRTRQAVLCSFYTVLAWAAAFADGTFALAPVLPG